MRVQGRRPIASAILGNQMRRIEVVADTFRTIAAPRSAYLLAVLLPAVAMTATAVASRLLGGDVGLPLLSLAVFLTALAGGFPPGVVATVVSAVLEVGRQVFSATPGAAVTLESPRLILFVGAGLLVSWASGVVLRTRARAELDRSHEGGARALAEAEAARAASIARLSAGLARTLTSEQVAQVLDEWGPPAFGAHPEVHVDTADGLRLVPGAEADPLPSPPAVPATSPVAEVGRTGRAAFVADSAAIRARFPESDPAPDAPALAILPLEAKGRRLGVVTWAFPRAHAFTATEADFISTVTDLAAQALDRSLSYEAELSSRKQAEASRQRLDLLADAGRILGASLDYERTLEALARLAVPMLGDFAILDLVEADGVHRMVVTASPVHATAARVLEDYPVDLESQNPVAEAIRSGRTLIVDVNEEMLAHIGQSDAHREASRAMGIQRAMVVAIRLRERSIGSLLFATADPARQYESTDIAVAEVLAQRAAKAIDNGRMHREIQRLAEHEQVRAAELESVISAIGEGIVVCGPDGSVRSMNEAAERILGGHIPDLDGLRSRVRPHGGALPPPGISLGPVECQLVERRNAWVELTAYAVARDRESGSAGGTVFVMRDVTTFRQGQRLREAFLSLLSHELRTPVTTIYAAANVLGKPGSTLEAETRLEILSDMVGESNRLYRLVEDLMVLARFDEGLDLARDPNLLQHLVPSVVQSERTRWPNVEFRITSARDLPTVNGDDTSIQQVLRNLLSNAAKYGPPGSLVEVMVEPERDGAAVRVLDEGVGIRSEEVEDLFDPFYRSPTTAKLASGAGIGLYVCRRLIDAMGGRIWARPRPGGGSEFGFWLPRYAGAPDELADLGSPTEPEPEPVQPADRIARLERVMQDKGLSSADRT
jgi:signal transduction histidine kinase